MMKTFLSLILFCGFAAVFTSCKSTTEPVTPQTTTSFTRMQAKVFSVSCATSGCHTQGSPYAVESGLVLEKDVAYANLVGVAAHHEHANADRLLRVKAGDPDNSFLFMKLHGIPSGKDYGSPMPLGGKSLSLGQIAFIRQWILEGAKSTGDDIDPTLLDDTTQPVVADFTPLAPPAPGEGFQLKIEKFSVAPNFEREVFVYRDVANPTDLFINRIQTKMRPGSHHFLLYTFDPSTPASTYPPFDLMRDIRDSTTGKDIDANKGPMAYHVYYGGTQMGGDVDYVFPPGVGLYLPKNSKIDLNTHYINRTADGFPGECYANLYTMPASEVKHLAGTLNLGNYSISLPAKKITTLTQNFPNTYGVPISVFVLTSHSHSLMTKFQIKITGGPRNGEVIYEATEWAHPGIKDFPTPVVIAPGEGLTSVVTYNNTTDKTVRFGLTSKDEMNIIFGYFYY